MRVVLVVALAYAARDFWQHRAGGATAGRAPDLAYTDTKGGFHPSLAAAGKPALVVLWVTPCPYCAKALDVLDGLRRQYPEEDLDVVGFYLNTAEKSAVDQIASAEGHSIMMAQGQPTGPFVEALTASLGFRAPGRDIYIIGKDGKYETVDTSDLKVPNYQIAERVRAILREKHGLKERAG